MPHELVVVIQLVRLDPHDAAIIANSDQEIATFGVQERRDGLEHRVRHLSVVLPVLPEVPAQGGLELQRLRFSRPYQLLSAPVGPEVLVKQEILDDLPEPRVIGDPLVEIEIGIHDLLDHVLDLLVEGEPDVLAGIDPGRRVECGVLVQALHHLAEGDPMLRSEVQTEALVQLGDDARERLHFALIGAVARPGAYRIEHSGPPLQRDLSAGGLLDPVGFHVDVLLDLPGQFLALQRYQPPEVSRKDVELLQVGIGEGKNLRQEDVQPDVIAQQAAEITLFFFGQLAEARDDRRENRIEPVLPGPGVEIHPGERLHIRLGVHREAKQPGLMLVEKIRVGAFGEQGGFVVGLERRLDLVGFVREVEHHGALLLRVSPVEPGEGLHRIHPAQLLVHVHGVEERLVEPGLELVGHHQKATLGSLEGLCGLGFGDPPVHR